MSSPVNDLVAGVRATIVPFLAGPFGLLAGLTVIAGLFRVGLAGTLRSLRGGEDPTTENEVDR